MTHPHVMESFRPGVPGSCLALLVIVISLLLAIGDRASADDFQPATAHRLIVGWDLSFGVGESLKFELICDRKQPRADGPAFDNLLLGSDTP